jgi:pSer/pThr/pTyr-binding forkhead associated (FHA) protein
MSTRVCAQCGAESPVDFRFCGRCGNKLEDAPAPGVGGTMYFGAMQAQGRAKLVLIKGDGMDGISYQLAGTEHVAGRVEGAILFPEDPLLSPRHASFVYRDNLLFVEDLGSQNGVFMRIRQPVELESGGVFLVGEQLLQVEACAPDLGPQLDTEGTCFYSSPKRASRMQLIQRLRGGDVGMVFRARNEALTIGREGNDVNFPDDPFISGHHAKVTCSSANRFELADLGSKNGTFVRVPGEAQLNHGDFIFLGQQLLRVEIA